MESYEEMEKTIQTLRQENLSLKRQNGGMKTSNANYKKQVAELKAKVEHYKALCKEGDELYEQALGGNEEKLQSFKAAVEELKKQHRIVVDRIKSEYDKKIASLEIQRKELSETITAKQHFIDTLQEKAAEQLSEISGLESKVSSQEDIIKEMESTVNELRKPWWKRIF